LAPGHFGDSAPHGAHRRGGEAGADQPWLADAAAELAQQTGAAVSVVSLDGLDVEALSPTPRSEFREMAEKTVNALGERLRAAGIEADGDVRPGLVVPGVLLYAEEKDADVIVCGASTKGRLARRVLGSVPVELIQRARRPVLVISPP
jgi:nucleotide-binding universal stress UspA family protein